MLQELAEERSAQSTLLLSRDEIDRVLMARLLDPPAGYPQWPLHYLLGSYARCEGGLLFSQLLSCAPKRPLRCLHPWKVQA